jgi:type IX secretion system PorP/SprF family membrane protein
MIRVFLITILFLNVKHLIGQDLHFSQYHSAPLHLNPSMVGALYDGSVITLNYRSQWAPVLGNEGAFKTMAGTFERRFNFSNQSFLNGGLSVWKDKAGAIQQNEAKMAISYGRLMAKTKKWHHYLLGGGQAGASQHIIDASDRRWLSQYDGNGGFDASKSGEAIDFPQKTFFDVSMGISVYSLYNNKNYYVIGAAIHHLNKPDISLTKTTSNPLQYMRYTVHVSGSKSIGTSPMRILPSVLMMKQGSSVEVTPGMAFKWVFDQLDYRSVQLGGWARMVNKPEKGMMTDAWVALIRFDWKSYGLGFSYDFNTSSLNATNRNNNGVELSLSYRFGAWTGIKMVTPRYFD